ncbi:MAG: branched-chain amino acid ABC transporter permease [Candidatus Tectomicrobia bacterium]|uniref:Branched-chain amino acid ABC transporter permease n=1 Tax=Tectimicrobiota bacterium TaxID=2528274 RepID=A0A933GKT1_UNCTE|nr:branched-chain amino acid ABC transporter permease [Candidatus Tectomicrobia bacterium]
MIFDILLEQLIYGCVLGSIYAMLAVGFSLVMGVMDTPNLAHGSFYMLASYIFAISMQDWGLHPLLSLVVSVAIVILLGLAVERGLLARLYHLPVFHYMFSVILLTIGLDIVMQKFAGIMWGHWPRYVTIPHLSDAFVQIGPLRTDLLKIIIVIVVFVLIFGLDFFVKRTKPGRALRAIVQDRETAFLMGINVDRLFTFCFVLSVGLAAVAGCLVGPVYSVEPEMGASVLAKAFVIVILAGFGNIRATLLASLLLGIWENLAVNFVPAAFIYAAEFIVLIIYFLFRGSDLITRIKKVAAKGGN